MTVAVITLVLGVLPLSGTVIGVVGRSLHHQSGMPSIVILVSVVAVGFVGISLTILRRLRRGEILDWLGGGPLNYLLVLFIVILAALMNAEATTVEHLMVRHGVRPRVAELLTLLPIAAGGLVFAVYWRRASSSRVRQ
jgi:amino acid transporter